MPEVASAKQKVDNEARLRLRSPAVECQRHARQTGKPDRSDEEFRRGTVFA